MTERAPIEVTNLDRYGSSELSWSRASDLLANAPLPEVFLGTSRPNGRPRRRALVRRQHLFHQRSGHPQVTQSG